MKRFLAIYLLSSLAFAHGGISLNISHPRKPSHQTDSYSVHCNKECAISIKSNGDVKGSSELSSFESKILEIINLEASGKLPKADRASLKKTLYKIEAVNGRQKVEIILGYPKSYSGPEFQKYSNLIIKIEDLKREMKLKVVDKK